MKEALTALAGSALPTLMVFVGILLNRNDINRLDGRITTMEGSLRGEMNAMRDRFHSDMMMLMSSNAAIDARVSKLEEKSEKKIDWKLRRDQDGGSGIAGVDGCDICVEAKAGGAEEVSAGADAGASVSLQPGVCGVREDSVSGAHSESGA